MVYRENRMSQEKKRQWKKAYQTANYYEGIAFTEKTRPSAETLFFTPCPGVENA